MLFLYMVAKIDCFSSETVSKRILEHGNQRWAKLWEKNFLNMVTEDERNCKRKYFSHAETGAVCRHQIWFQIDSKKESIWNMLKYDRD